MEAPEHRYSPQHPLKVYELNCTDKLYALTIPDYESEAGVVYYRIILKDLLTNETSTGRIRFK